MYSDIPFLLSINTQFPIALGISFTILLVLSLTDEAWWHMLISYLLSESHFLKSYFDSTFTPCLFGASALHTSSLVCIQPFVPNCSVKWFSSNCVQQGQMWIRQIVVALKQLCQLPLFPIHSRFFLTSSPQLTNRLKFYLSWKNITLDLRALKHWGKHHAYCLGYHTLESLAFPLSWDGESKIQGRNEGRRRKGRSVWVLDFRSP